MSLRGLGVSESDRVLIFVARGGPSSERRLSGLPIESINLRTADVTRYQQRITRPQTAPLCVRSPEPMNIFQAGQALQPVIGNSHPEECRIFRKSGIEVQVLPVMRPTRISDAHPHQLGPLLIGAIEQQEGLRVRRNPRDVAAVGGPAR